MRVVLLYCDDPIIEHVIGEEISAFLLLGRSVHLELRRKQVHAVSDGLL